MRLRGSRLLYSKGTAQDKWEESRMRPEDVPTAVRLLNPSPAVCVAGPITPNKGSHGRWLLPELVHWPWCSAEHPERTKGRNAGPMAHYESENEKRMKFVPSADSRTPR